MENRFELTTGDGIGKDTAGEFSATHLSIGLQNFSTKQPRNLFQRGLARLDNLPGQVVGIYHGKPARSQMLGRHGLAHADAACQTHHFHRVAIRAQAQRDRSTGSGLAG
jgi:hypothetical protein